MDNKYIIRNCPSIYENYEAKFICTTQIKQKGFPYYCQDCTDCLMKQIVELCEEEQQSRVATNILSNKILQLLDIWEVE